MGDDFLIEGFGLVLVVVGVVGGYIFLNLFDDLFVFELFCVVIEFYLLLYDLDNVKVVYIQLLVEQVNWKLVIENNCECYYCVGLYFELMYIIMEFDDLNDLNVSLVYKVLLLKKGVDWDVLCLLYVYIEISL